MSPPKEVTFNVTISCLLLSFSSYVFPSITFSFQWLHIDLLASVFFNHIGGVSMLASIAVYHEFEPRSDQNKDHEIGICCLSTMHAALR